MITRSMRPEDRRFIVPTWVRSFAQYSPWGRKATLASHWEVVDKMLNDPGIRVTVLASDESARTLHAWAAGTVEGLHYVYVPPELRGNGLARRCITAMLGAYPVRIEVSHPWPRASERFCWMPYPIMRTAA